MCPDTSVTHVPGSDRQVGKWIVAAPPPDITHCAPALQHTQSPLDSAIVVAIFRAPKKAMTSPRTYPVLWSRKHDLVCVASNDSTVPGRPVD
jgi:hypothetical protein